MCGKFRTALANYHQDGRHLPYHHGGDGNTHFGTALSTEGADARTMVLMSEAASLTDLIRRAQAGDPAALRSVFAATYDELRGLARVRLGRSGRNILLDTTSLVHESYLRFAGSGQLNIHDRQHFMSYAGHVMRSVIVDFVRERVALRRGGDIAHVTLNSQIEGGDAEAEGEILRVHEALDQLAEYDPRLVRVVE